MKTITYLFIFLTMSLLLSCDGWLDVNKDPNNPTEVSSDLVLPAGQASIAVNLGGSLFNTAGFFAQYWSQAPGASQYNFLETYDLRTDFLNVEYNEMFAGGLNDLERVRTDAEEKKNWGDYFVATVLRVYTFQMWVDMVDKVPYRQALQGLDYLNPEWEEGEQVYFSLIEELNEAESKLEKVSGVSGSDLMLDGDLNEWRGFANALKLKMYMRASYKRDIASQVRALIEENNFMTRDVAFSAFENVKNKRNPWYETAEGFGDNHVATVTIIRFLEEKSDPRLEILFDKAKGPQTFEGIYPALKQIETGLKADDYSKPQVDTLQPVYFFTLSELHLFIAEAELRFNNDPETSKTAYEEAIDANLKLHNIAFKDLYSDNTKAYYFDPEAPVDTLMEKIMMQKWVSLCMINHFEAWCELRRTKIPRYYGDYNKYGNGEGYPAGQYLNPAKNVRTEGVYVPNRLPYPDVAVSRNVNTPRLTGNQAFENKIWWDVK